MSFFLELATTQLVNHFSQVVKTADEKDEGVVPGQKHLNGFLHAMTGMGRNPELSNAKKRVGNEAVEALNKLKLRYKFKLAEVEQDCERSGEYEGLDEYLKMECLRIIQRYSDDMAEIFTKYDPSNKGSTVKAITAAKTLLQRIEEYCQDPTIDVWDLSYDEGDPLSIFQCCSLLYICSKINTEDRFSEQKVKAIKEILDTTCHTYRSMTSATPEEKIDFILRQIKTAQEKNKLLCLEHPHGIDLPIEIGMFFNLKLTTKFNPATGALGQMMETAYSQVEALKDAPQHHVRSDSTYRAMIGLRPGNGVTVYPTTGPGSVAASHATPDVPLPHGRVLSIQESIVLEDLESLDSLFNRGFTLESKINSQGQNPLELAVSLDKYNVINAIKSRFAGDKHVEDAFQAACKADKWQCAQAIDKERALAAEFDKNYRGKLHWYSMNNTAVKSSFINDAEDFINRNGASIDKKRFYDWMAKSQTATYRQFKFWASEPTNTTSYFRAKVSGLDSFYRAVKPPATAARF